MTVVAIVIRANHGMLLQVTARPDLLTHIFRADDRYTFCQFWQSLTRSI